MREVSTTLSPTNQAHPGAPWGTLVLTARPSPVKVTIDASTLEMGSHYRCTCNDVNDVQRCASELLKLDSDDSDDSDDSNS